MKNHLILKILTHGMVHVVAASGHGNCSSSSACWWSQCIIVGGDVCEFFRFH